MRKAHRRRGLALALLRHSFSDFRRRGFSKVGLGVDASNESRAVHLYESLDMQAERVYLTYEKHYSRYRSSIVQVEVDGRCRCGSPHDLRYRSGRGGI